MDLIVDLLYFPIPVTIVVGLIAWVFLWRKGRRFLAILAIPFFWIIIISLITSVIFFNERKHDLDRKPYIPIDRVFERNVNTYDTSIEFYKFITTKERAFLMAKISIDPALITASIREDCIKLTYLAEKLHDPFPYSGDFPSKGLGPLTPADPDNDLPIVWIFPPDIITTTDPEEIVQNLDVQISSFEPCHTFDGR